MFSGPAASGKPSEVRGKFTQWRQHWGLWSVQLLRVSGSVGLIQLRAMLMSEAHVTAKALIDVCSLAAAWSHINAAGCGRASPAPPRPPQSSSQLLASEIGWKRLILPGELATWNLTIFWWVYGQHEWTYFPFFWGRRRRNHRGEGQTWKDWEVNTIGVYDVRFPYN